MNSNWLAPEVFSTACEALPLISLDLCLTRPGPAGLELLLGFRTNRPAQGYWFTPGGRIRKNEPMSQAMGRLARDELGLSEHLLQRAVLMGAWDHFYADSAFEPAISTHYVNLPHRLNLSEAEAASLLLPSQGARQDRYAGQHANWRWEPVSQAATDATVHPYAQAYATWVHLAHEQQAKLISINHQIQNILPQPT